MAAGNRHLGYKRALDVIEASSPGAKHSFYFGFLERAASLFAPVAEEERSSLSACSVCGAPTTAEVCAFCRLVERSAAHAPVSVDLIRKKSRAERRATVEVESR